MLIQRSLAAVLWFFAAWYAGALVAHHIGVSDLLGPTLGVIAAAVFAGDPRHVIWTRKSATDDRGSALRGPTPAETQKAADPA